MSKLKKMNDKYYKECNVIILSTNEKIIDRTSNLDNFNTLLSYHNSFIYKIVNRDIVKQHLYITSNEEIKEGDKVICILNNKITYCKRISEYNESISFFEFNVRTCKTKDYYFGESMIDSSPSNYKKIIASTDLNLKLPKPSIQFINKYIEEYNKSNIITKILVEYWIDYEPGNRPCDRKYDTVNLKIDKNNTISIKSIKDSWDRDEVSNILHLFGSNINDIEKQTVCPIPYIDKWIEENL